MNLVALLIAPAVVRFGYGDDASPGVRAVVAGVAIIVIVAAVYASKRRPVAGDGGGPPDGPRRVAGSPDEAPVR